MPDNTHIRHRGAAAAASSSSSGNNGNVGSCRSIHFHHTNHKTNNNNGKRHTITSNTSNNNSSAMSLEEDDTTKDEFYDDDNNTVMSAAAASSSSVYSNNSGSQMTSRSQKKSAAAAAASLDHVDEEQGIIAKNKSYKHKTSFETNHNTRRSTTSHLDNIIDTSSSSPETNPLLLPYSSSSSSSSSPDTNKSNNKHRDARSKTLFLKTAFWITAWYTTSLATLFLNKIILSRKGSSVHVLGMCQMTTAAVIGGWSSLGGLDWCKRWGLKLLRNTIGGGGGGGGASVVDFEKRGEQQQTNDVTATTTTTTSSSSSGSTQQSSSPHHHPHFARDMSIVGLLRGLTVVLGLIALEHVPVSFVETIKATAPAFTVLFARLILKEHTPSPVMLTLLPVVGGLILCSKSELRFDTIGFLAAVTNNCADCVQNVMSKRMLTHLRPTQLQFYTSVAALVLQCPWVLRDVSNMIMSSWSAGGGSGGGGGGHFDNDDEALYAAMMKGETMIHPEDDEGDPNEMSLGKLLLIDAVFYHLQSVSAYCTMGCMSPVSQSVANTLKRALLVWASILYFHNPITNSGILGIIMVVSGVFLYNHVRRIHQS